ncbi:Spore coat protein SA [uncultured bacterium]|nr:Spore coat protein SA [uncultured bacterium]
MRVLSVSYPFAPVRPETPGGAEQVLLALDRALVRSGHGSFVVATVNSTVSGTLLPVPRPPGVIDAQVRADVYEACRSAIRDAVEELDIDVVHMHGVDFHEYMPPDGVPVLVTLHLPLSWYPEKALKTQRPCTYFNCVSKAQESSLPDGAGPVGRIDNGVDIGFWRTARNVKKEYALSMGRVCAEKGFHIAMDAARSAGVPFILAGAVFGYKEHEEYYRDFISPRLSPVSRFIGMVGPGRKRRLLSGARCLLVPSLAPETSSLVAMEALASGTPVVAFANGALAEIVEDGRTGFLVKDEKEMSSAIRECRGLSGEACRRSAAERFAASAMIEKYFETYGNMAACEA